MHSLAIVDRRVVDIPDVEQTPARVCRRQEEFPGERLSGGDDACRCCAKAPRSACSASCALHREPVDRQADLGAGHLRRPGRDRDRERASAREVQNAPTICPNRCNSRPPPPTCSRSSAARRSICSTVLDTLAEIRGRLCDADQAHHHAAQGRPVLSLGMPAASRPRSLEYDQV